MTTNPTPVQPAAEKAILDSLLPVSRREQIEGDHIRVYIGSGPFVIAEQIYAVNGNGDNASLEERRAIADLFVHSVNQSAAFDAAVTALEMAQAVLSAVRAHADMLPQDLAIAVAERDKQARAALAQVGER